MNRVQQNLTLKAANRAAIENGYMICKNQSVEYWRNMAPNNYINNAIIEELINDEDSTGK